MSKLDLIPDYDKAGRETKTPLETLVKKFEESGYTVEQAFDIFDDNGDGVLTVKEVKQGLRDQEIPVNDEEVTALVAAIDADKNGVVTRKEWADILEPQLAVEVDFRNIMSNINIDDPIELEEKTLDLKFRSRRLEQELMILRSKNGEIGNLARGAEARKRAMERKLAEKVKELESKFEDKMKAQQMDDASIENRIKDSMMAKDQVY